jgi:hypothetical protein
MTSVTSVIVVPFTGVLVGSTGPHRNIVKVRPPRAFTTKHIASFITAWTATPNEKGRNAIRRDLVAE